RSWRAAPPSHRRNEPPLRSRIAGVRPSASAAGAGTSPDHPASPVAAERDVPGVDRGGDPGPGRLGDDTPERHAAPPPATAPAALDGRCLPVDHAAIG